MPSIYDNLRPYLVTVQCTELGVVGGDHWFMHPVVYAVDPASARLGAEFACNSNRVHAIAIGLCPMPNEKLPPHS